MAWETITQGHLSCPHQPLISNEWLFNTEWLNNTLCHRLSYTLGTSNTICYSIPFILVYLLYVHIPCFFLTYQLMFMFIVFCTFLHWNKQENWTRERTLNQKCRRRHTNVHTSTRIPYPIVFHLLCLYLLHYFAACYFFPWILHIFLYINLSSCQFYFLCCCLEINKFVLHFFFHVFLRSNLLWCPLYSLYCYIETRTQ